jgi:hypothetical protein
MQIFDLKNFCRASRAKSLSAATNKIYVYVSPQKKTDLYWLSESEIMLHKARSELTLTSIQPLMMKKFR